ncbi:MAG TPA: PAS domain S-box protein [Terriglobia bacterium]|nr:PAS domain S-box protein [Terriglobia bacterium]
MTEQAKNSMGEVLTNSLSEMEQPSGALKGSQDARWQVEEQFRLVVESVKDYAIFMLDTQGNIVSWNQGAERLKGYRASEIIGRNFSVFYTPEDRKSGAPAKSLSTAAKDGRSEIEGWRVRKDGSRFWADVVITALKDSQSRLVAFLKITRDLTERVQREHALETSQNTLRELSLQLLRAQDEERQRIGRDLHDGAGQYLAMLKMHLESLKSGRVSVEAVRERLDDLVQLAAEALREVRTTSYQLSPPMLEECGLALAIPWLLDGFMERSGIATTYDISGFERLSRGVEVVIYRVLQECIANVGRHSGSKTVHIKLQKKGGTMWLEVRDQGRGIPEEVLEAFRHNSPGKLGVGLRSVKERIYQLGGELTVNSDEHGTVISAMVPV